MANITLGPASNTPQFGGTPYGNFAANRFRLQTSAIGAVVGADVLTAVQIGDIIRVGVLPRGMLLIDLLAIISVGWTASATFKLGFLYVDGVDSSVVPQDDDYFIVAATSLATAARIRANNPAVEPVTLPKDAYLVLTTAGAANAKVSTIDFFVENEDRGPL